MTRVLSALNFLLTFSLLGFPLPAQAQQQPQKIIIAGAQSLTPLAEKFSAQFHKEHPGIQIEIRRGNSNYAVNAARNDEIDIGLVTRKLSPAETAELHAEPLGHDAIIFLSYPWNTVAQARAGANCGCPARAGADRSAAPGGAAAGIATARTAMRNTPA